MIKPILCHIITGCLVLLQIGAMAQPDSRPSLAEVEIQKIFIEANKEKVLGNYQDAAYLFREVLNKDPDNHSAAYELARMYDVLEEDAQALKAIEKAVKLNKGNIWYQDFYATVLERNQRYGQAADVYQQLAKAHPHNEYFLIQQANFLIKANKPAKAVVVFDKVERLIGVNEYVAREKYALYYGLGDNKAAVAEINKLIKAFPDEKNYLFILADFHNKNKDTKAAREVYERVLELDPKDPEANLAMAESFKKKGEHIRFLNAIQPVIAKSDVDIDLKVKELFPYIKMLRDNSNNELKRKALELGATLTEAHSEDAKAHSLYADMLSQAGETEAALAAYQRTLELDKSVFAVWEQIMYIHAEMGNMKELRKVSTKALDFFPNQSKVYYMNGVAGSALGDHKEAADMFEQALMMSGKNIALKYDICNRLGIEYFNLGRYDRSDKMFERALELMPDAYSALHNYSFHLARQGRNLGKAKTMSLRANELLPNQSALQTNLSYILFQLEEYKAARDWAEKAIKNGGEKSPKVQELYGDILYKQGDKTEALEHWRNAKAYGGNSEELNRKIADEKL